MFYFRSLRWRGMSTKRTSTSLSSCANNPRARNCSSNSANSFSKILASINTSQKPRPTRRRCHVWQSQIVWASGTLVGQRPADELLGTKVGGDRIFGRLVGEVVEALCHQRLEHFQRVVRAWSAGALGGLIPDAFDQWVKAFPINNLIEALNGLPFASSHWVRSSTSKGPGALDASYCLMRHDDSRLCFRFTILPSASLFPELPEVPANSATSMLYR